ncbi:hypothetical protein CVT91_07865 [Candidatus Atribacteria bacterium HGW-Atribacteria-1]|nr:MAG: hypothetical protein CVT91_07865 [Candidatus Atribacteria bacterium HGW-Atribacteria-1]
MRIIKNITNLIKYTYQDNLYRNGIHLMLTNIVTGLFGFVFLMIATRLYSSQDVGMYSALFSVISLIVLFSVGGFSNTIIRLVPTASQPDRNKLIFSSFVIMCFTVMIVSLIFVFFIDVFSPKLIFLKDLFYGFIFILFTVFAGIYTLFNGVFMAFRKTQYILINNIITNIGKIFLLPSFVSLLYIGIFYSAGIATFLGVVICLFLLYEAKLIKNFKLSMNFDIIKKNFKYILTNYFSSIASQLFGLLLPILILNILFAEITAYFFIAWTIFSIITQMTMSIIMSFFVEGSYKEDEIKKNRNKGLKAALIIATISVIGVFLFGKFLLSLFGEEYLNSLNLLYVFAISIYFFVVNKIYLVELLIKKKMKETIIFNFLITIPTIIFGTLLMFYFGLMGVGYGWLIGQLIGIIWILARLKLS